MKKTTKNAVEEPLAGALVSHFTPSLMLPATLEAILVEREDLASSLVEEVLESATNPTKAQTLLVGPRGIGKTHLLTVVYHRVRAAKPRNLCIAWLREEEYGVVSWLDMLLRIFRALEEESPGTTPRADLEPLYDLPAAAAEREAQRLLQEYLAGRTLWLLVENLDAIFADIKEAGQRKWRAWMQEQTVVTTLATTPGLFGGISGRSAPFYGFFRIEHLQPLDVDGAVLLLRKLAKVRGDEELADFIATSAGHARVRAVHHLAGGNFRVYVIFASFLKRASLDELVAPFLQLLDELTPYYQSHLAALSAQQRKIIEVLCDYRAPMPVKLLASRGFMSPQTASSQLVELRDRGYVTPQSRGRESLYELREPLLRLCLEVKKQRGEPVALLIEFLRLWYRRDELSHHLESCAPDAVWERQYLMRALAEKDKETEDPHLAACERDSIKAINMGDWGKVQRIFEEIIDIRGNAFDWFRHSAVLTLLDLHEDSLKSLDHALEMDQGNYRLWRFQGLNFMELGLYDDSLQSIDKAINICDSAKNLKCKGLILWKMGRFQDSIQTLSASLRKKFDPDTLFIKGSIESETGQWKRALRSFQILEKKKFDPLEIWPLIAVVYDNLNDSEKSLQYRLKLIQLQPDSAKAHSGLAHSALRMHQLPLALASANRAIELGEESPHISFYRAQTLLGLDEEEGFDALRDSLSKLGSLGSLWAFLFFFLETLYLAFEQKPDANVWTRRLLRLTAIFESEKTLPTLSTALTKFTGSIIQTVTLERETNPILPATDEMRPQARKVLEWSRSWLALFDSAEPGEYASLRFAARLSAAAIEVAVSGDERSLLDLTSEERAIVRDMLDWPSTENRKTKRK